MPCRHKERHRERKSGEVREERRDASVKGKRGGSGQERFAEDKGKRGEEETEANARRAGGRSKGADVRVSQEERSVGREQRTSARRFRTQAQSPSGEDNNGNYTKDVEKEGGRNGVARFRRGVGPGVASSHVTGGMSEGEVQGSAGRNARGGWKTTRRTREVEVKDGQNMRRRNGGQEMRRLESVPPWRSSSGRGRREEKGRERLQKKQRQKKRTKRKEEKKQQRQDGGYRRS